MTLIRISPGPGAGTARVSGTSTSGPPGLLMPMTVICAGSLSMVCPCETRDLLLSRGIGLASRASTGNRSPTNAARRNPHGHREGRRAEGESHPRDRAGPVTAIGRGGRRTDCADDLGERAVAGRDGQKAEVTGRRQQLLQIVTER